MSISPRPLLGFLPGPSQTTSALRRRLAALLVATALAPALVPLIPDSGHGPGIVSALARENVAIDRLEFSGKAGSIVLNGITATGSSLSKSDIEGLFKADSLAKAHALLAKLDAENFLIKSVVVTLQIDKQKSVTTYDGFEAKGIKAGLIDRLVIRETRQETTAPEAPKNMALKAGEMSIEKLDLAGIFAWMTQSDPSGKAPMKQLHGRYEMAPITMTADQFEFRMGKAHATGFKARLPRQPMTDLIPLVERLEKDKDDPANGLKVVSAALDLYLSFEFGEGAVEGMSFKGPSPKAGGEFNGNLGKMLFGGGAKPYFTLEGMDFKANDGFFKLKKFGFEGDFYGIMLVMLQRVFETLPSGSNSSAAPQEAELRKLVAESATRFAASSIAYRLEGMEFDVPPSDNAKSKDRVKLSIANYSTSMGKFIGFVPSKIDIALDAFRMPIPADSKDQGLKNLREVGISELDLASKIKLSWDEPSMKLSVEDVSAELGKFGRVAITGELGNVPRQLFENPQQNWPIAMMTANAQKLSVAIENKGGFDKLLEKAAKDQGKKPDQLRTEIATMAPAMIGAFMAAHPDAQLLADAIGKFGKSLGALSVVARGATPAGLTAADVMAAGSNPAALLNKIRFEASAK